VEIHQVLVGASAGDAITNEALQLQRLLQRAGPSEIFARYIGEGVEGIRFLEEYAGLDSARRGQNLLILHSSIGEPAVFDFLESRPERLVLRFHNITPPAMFERYDPPFARILEEGLRELTALRDRSVVALADSAFNAVSLKELGYRNIRVAPLLLDLDAFVNIPPEAIPMLSLPPTGTPVILFVGRLAPSKGYHDLVKAFHVLKTYLHPEAQLWCVGGKAHGAYRAAVDRFVRELGLRDVVYPGAISDPQLAWVFRRADVYLSLSAHEGFGVPLLEAMAHGVPVVAWNNTAVGDTVGDAGILLSGPGPLEAAEAVHAVLEDARLRDELVARGRRRTAAFRGDRAGRIILEALLEVA
jgi:glycosyltransferase involved in cell wall biosynthesis